MESWGEEKGKELTVARTDPKLSWRSYNQWFGLAGVQHFYKIKETLPHKCIEDAYYTVFVGYALC